jgi:hypothetical protein
MALIIMIGHLTVVGNVLPDVGVVLPSGQFLE